MMYQFVIEYALSFYGGEVYGISEEYVGMLVDGKAASATDAAYLGFGQEVYVRLRVDTRPIELLGDRE